MINIFTILIITYIINICLLKSINNLSLKEDVALDACNTDLEATWADPGTDSLVRFSKETDAESGVITDKYITNTNVFIYKTTGNEKIEINAYASELKEVTDKSYRVTELQNVYYAKKEGSGDFTFENNCDPTIPLGDCVNTTIYVGIKTIDGAAVYLDKCSVTAAYSGDVAGAVVAKYTHLSDAKDKLLKSSITNVRMSRTINNKISTTLINAEATKYCHINNLNGYHMIFVGTFKADVVGTASDTLGTPLVLSDAADIKYYNETNSEIKIICGKKAESGSGGNSGGSLKNKNSLNSLKAETTDCDPKYATFKIESNNVKHYFYINSFYLGEKSTDKFSIPKSVADGVSAEDQWCFNGLEINKISIININIFIIIIVLLLSLI